MLRARENCVACKSFVIRCFCRQLEGEEEVIEAKVASPRVWRDRGVVGVHGGDRKSSCSGVLGRIGGLLSVAMVSC